MSMIASIELKPTTQPRAWHRALAAACIASFVAFLAGCAFTPWSARERYLALRSTAVAGRDLTRLDALATAEPAQPAEAVARAEELGVESPR
ncbi:MAG: hypothetical protein ACOYN0_07925 [Phycisphaerales bacterium]